MPMRCIEVPPPSTADSSPFMHQREIVEQAKRSPLRNQHVTPVIHLVRINRSTFQNYIFGASDSLKHVVEFVAQSSCPNRLGGPRQHEISKGAEERVLACKVLSAREQAGRGICNRQIALRQLLSQFTRNAARIEIRSAN
jgi:hypothetical protein